VCGDKQRGARHAVIVQADEFLDLSTVLVSPTFDECTPSELSAYDLRWP